MAAKENKDQETVKDLKDLGAATGTETDAAPEATQDVKPREPKIDAQGRAYATGRRKESVARVWIKKGSGKVIVNGKAQDDYFGRPSLLLVLNQPFLETGQINGFDVVATVKGGGKSGQAGAVRHGISRALENFDPNFRPALKKAGMLTRDARMVERKKIGKHKARRTKQWAKR